MRNFNLISRDANCVCKYCHNKNKKARKIRINFKVERDNIVYYEKSNITTITICDDCFKTRKYLCELPIKNKYQNYDVKVL